MGIRPAEPRDLDAIADIAQDQRIRQHGWDADLWPLAASARELHPVTLGRQLDDGRMTNLVAATREPDGRERLVGYVLAGSTTSPGDGRMLWVVDDIAVADPGRWATVGLALLAALADRAVRQRVDRVVVGCPVADRLRRQSLEGARLDLNCWYRVLDLSRGALAPPPPGDDEPGLPLPHFHGQLPAVAGAAVVAANGASAMLTASLTPSSLSGRGGTYAVADPVVASDGAGLHAALDAIEATCRERGDRAVLVAVGPGEGPLDDALERRGYVRATEWWLLRPVP